MGVAQPAPATLRVELGVGLTGWAALHNETIRLGDARTDPRSLVVSPTDEPTSMLIVPMAYDDQVRGVIVVSEAGRDRFDADDERTLSVFAAYAAQALVNAENRERLRHQEEELDRRIASQRRLLEVNERLLSTLDASSILDLIADSLDALVPYDSLTVYRIDRTAGLRRPVIARDRFAEAILADVGPLGSGLTGWVVEHGEALLSNEAHLDPRSTQVPGTPFEPEGIIVVPLHVGEEVVGTLNIGRLGDHATDGTGFTPQEFELTKVFASQASIALSNAETHDEVRLQAEHDALTGLRNHGAFQRELGEIAGATDGTAFSLVMFDLDGFKAFNDTCGHPAGDALLTAIAGAMRGAVRNGDRLYRYGGDEFAAILGGTDRAAAQEVTERIRQALGRLPAPAGAPRVGISAGVACFPEDGHTKDQLVTLADKALYLAKPASRHRAGPGDEDPYVRALDETAMALMDRHDPMLLLDTILTRATGLLGVPHGYIYLVESGERELVVRHGIGIFTEWVGTRLPAGEGLAGEVFRTGRVVAVDDYDRYANRASAMPVGRFGAVVGVPLTAGGKTVGVVGLASGSVERTFTEGEIDALGRFAQLASIALDNARLLEEARRSTLYDSSTGLPNRDLLRDRIKHALTFVRSDDRDPIAVLVLDLDRFKLINESVGHAFGDRLLTAIGQRLAACLRPGDTVARFGGDEFGIILDSVHDEAEAMAMARRILEVLQSPFPLDGRHWFVGASMGIAVAAPGRATPDELIRRAEIAMVHAKDAATGGYLVFDPSMSTNSIERLELEDDLRLALERDELVVHYQPLIDLATDQPVGFEALVRWNHPTRGLVPPHAFIPLAEESGLIVPLGRTVLRTACRQAARWRAEGNPDQPLFVSVNLSARQFAQPELADEIAALLDEMGLDPSGLELEITESVLMDQSERGLEALTRLRALGVRLVLDDFGTGYSSLSYLKHLPLDTIKIDRSFVSGIDEPADRSIVEAVVALAHGLGIGVVAEGIETEAQRAILRSLGCDLGQGYLFSPALPADAARDLLPGRRLVRSSPGA
jgi:diguanylate cyclase (GGDEF)-like protein